MVCDTDVLIIGAGMSGIGLAVQLIRTYGSRDFEIIEKTSDIGGTWWVNSYPGCGCDASITKNSTLQQLLTNDPKVPSHFFSYSFALNPDWSQKFTMQSEIHSYFTSVAAQYQLHRHVRFETVVESADWDETLSLWVVKIRDLNTSKTLTRRAKVLVSAVGALSTPKQCDITGAQDFQGRIFHTAQWDHSFDWENKEVVMIGNGCSATQALPIMSAGDQAVKKITQFARQSHWLAERPNPEYSKVFRWIMRWAPLAMRLYRAWLYWEMERDFTGFDTLRGVKTRQQWAKDATEYIKKMAPDKYTDFLVPKTEVGCKRRVNDTDYLACLHRDNVELVYEDPIDRIVSDGVRTKSGRFIPAEAIIMANGFETQKPMFPMTITGRDSTTVAEHWDQFSEGAASSYFGTCLSGFPNFFILMGPNTLSGHLSVIYTVECQINFTLRVIRPVLQARADTVEVGVEAEKRDIDHVQRKAKGLVWATGCTSWSIEEKSGRNTSMFPDWQYNFWARSVFVSWDDFLYKWRDTPRDGHLKRRTALVTASLAMGIAAAYKIMA